MKLGLPFLCWSYSVGTLKLAFRRVWAFATWPYWSEFIYVTMSVPGLWSHYA